MRTVMVKLAEAPLKECIWLRGRNEKRIFWDVIEYIKANQPVKAKELENKFGADIIYNVLQKIYNGGLVDKTQDGYVLSTRFAQILRKFADEWEIFVREGKWDVEGHEII